MEESEFSLELKFMEFILGVETLFFPFEIPSHPLFSFTVALCTLILLYLPHLFWKLVLSPVLILTGILLLTILRFGANQRSQNEQPEVPGSLEPGWNQENRASVTEEKEESENLGTETEESNSNSIEKVRQWITNRSEIEFKSQIFFISECFSGSAEPGLNQENRPSVVAEQKQSDNLAIETEESNSVEKVHQWITTHSETEFESKIGFSSECFIESWEVKAPLEVIYEEYEEGEEEAEVDQTEKEETGRYVDYPKYPLLSRYYSESESESESGSSSDGGFPPIGQWESPENTSFQWDEEDREGLIEIALDGGKKIAMDFQFEEDNLIEIDISPTRANEFSGDNEAIAGEIN